MTTPTGPRDAKVSLTATTGQYIKAMRGAAAETEKAAHRMERALTGVAAAWAMVAEAAALAAVASRAAGAIGPRAGTGRRVVGGVRPDDNWRRSLAARESFIENSQRKLDAGQAKADRNHATARQARWAREQQFADAADKRRAASDKRRADSAHRQAEKARVAAERSAERAVLARKRAALIPTSFNRSAADLAERQAREAHEQAKTRNRAAARQQSEYEKRLARDVEQARNRERRAASRASEARMGADSAREANRAAASAAQVAAGTKGTPDARLRELREVQNETRRAMADAATAAKAAERTADQTAARRIQAEERVTRAGEANRARQGASSDAAYRRQADAADRAIRAERSHAAESRAASARRAEAYSGVARSIGLASGIMIAGFLASAVAAIRWETALTGVTKTIEGTPEQFDALETGLRNLTKTLPATHREIAGVAEAAGQLGVRLPDIVAFTRTAVMLGVATTMSAEQAATSLAQFINAMGGSFKEVDRFGATLVALGNDGASTEAQILEMSKRIAGAGSTAGLSAPEIMGLANAMASLGIRSELGGGAMSRILTKITFAVQDGGKALRGFAAIAGVSAQEFADSWSNAPAAALLDLIANAQKIRQEGGNIFGVLQGAGLRNSRDLDVFQRLMNSVGSQADVSRIVELANRAWEENIALQKEANKRFQTTASQLRIAANRVNDLAIEIGGTLLPAIVQAADAAKDLADTFNSMDPNIKEGATRVGATVAGAGALTAVWLGAMAAGSRFDSFLKKHDLTVKKIGTRFAAFAVLLGGLQIMNKLIPEDTGPDVADLTDKIVELSRTGESGVQAMRNLSAETEGLGASLETVNGSSGFDQFLAKVRNFADNIPSVRQGLELADRLGITDGTKKMDEAIKQVAAWDQAITNNINAGNMTAAEKGIAAVHAEGKKMGLSQGEVNAQLVRTREAVKAARAEYDKANTSSRGMASGTQVAAKALKLLVVDAGMLSKELDMLLSSYFDLPKAQIDFNQALADLAPEAREATDALDQMRAAVGDSVSAEQAAEAAADEYKSTLADLREALGGVGDESKKAASDISAFADAVDQALGEAFDPQDALDKFKGKVEEIKKGLSGSANPLRDELIAKINMITEGGLDKNDRDLQKTVASLRRQLADELKNTPGSLSTEGDSEQARKNRDDVEELIRAQAELYKLTADPKDPSQAFGARRRELEAALRDIGYEQQAIADALSKFDDLPRTIADARKRLAESATGNDSDRIRSKRLRGDGEDERANRADVRKLAAAAAADIEQQIRPGMSERQVSALVKDTQAQLRRDLAALGFDPKDIAPYVQDLSGIPGAIRAARREAEGLDDSAGRELDKRQKVVTAIEAGVREFQAWINQSARTDGEIVAKANEIKGRIAESLAAQNLLTNETRGWLDVFGELHAAAKFSVQVNPNKMFEAIDAGVDAWGRAVDTMESNPAKPKADTSPIQRGIEKVRGWWDTLKTYVESSPLKPVIDIAANSPAFRGFQWIYDQFVRLANWINMNPLKLAFEISAGGASRAIWNNTFGRIPGVPQFKADGGWINGPGGPRDDKVPAMLSNREFVVNARAAKEHGGLLEAINSGRYKRGLDSPGQSSAGRAEAFRPFDASRFSRALTPATQAPQITVTGPDIDIGRLIDAMGNRPIVLQIDGRELARWTGKKADLARRTG